jgi:cytochrome b6-f complex iron-sulfur subunit
MLSSLDRAARTLPREPDPHQETAMAEEKSPPAPEAPKVATTALKPQPPKPGARPEPPKAGISGTSLQRRRDFVWYGCAALLLAGFATFIKIFFPRTLFEPKTRFVIGYPSDFGFGVDTKFQQSQRIWVCKGPQGIYVILAICTHLGCTPDWLSTENLFKCPCHGSTYDAEGRNFAGPAPRPMARCHVEKNAEGKIVVDKLKIYEAPQFDQLGAYLPV